MADVRERRVLNKNWLRKLLSGDPHFVIGTADDPYLLRWFLIPRNSRVNIYLHKFIRSDDDVQHDHPWWFISLILRGEYDEVVGDRVTRRKRGSVAFRRAEHYHQVRLVDGAPCVTLIVTGRKKREWGFYCPKGWMHWEKFTVQRVNGNHAGGCGELN